MTFLRFYEYDKTLEKHIFMLKDNPEMFKICEGLVGDGNDEFLEEMK